MADSADDAVAVAAVAENTAPDTTSDTAPTAVQGIVAFIANVREGWRVACMLRPNPEALRFSWGQVLALVAIDWLLGFAAQVAYVGFHGRFQTDVVPESLFLVPELALAWFLGRIDNMGRKNGKGPNAAGTERYLIALFALGVPINIAYLILFLVWTPLQPHLNAWVQWGLGYVPLVWYLLAASIVAVRLFGLRRMRALAGVIVVFAFLLAPRFVVDTERWLWMPQSSSEHDDAKPRKDYFASVREDNIYRQPQLLADALAKLKPGRPGQVDLYFVGAAGYASQDVFMKEVNSVTQLFDERFDTAGRSLKLINNADTIKDIPIASKTALQQAFARIARLMNPEDILFLYMTSHGSHTHKFSLDFGMMRFNDIDPPVLRKLLDDAGIKRRVIVVSACYSGGFVDALKNDDTLVITAAAADKNSFGCSNENDYTYFGKAYFDEALRKTYSFTKAFEMAKPVIAEREKKEDYTPSDPQISVGKDIAPVLDAYAEGLEKRANSNANSNANSKSVAAVSSAR